MFPSLRLRTSASIAVAMLVAIPLVSTPAAAQDIIAVDQSEPVLASTTRAPLATASIERGIVVTNHGGRSIVVSAVGEPTLRQPRPGSRPARFAGLSAGTRYTVTVGGRLVARVVAINRPNPASRLVVTTTTSPATVQLSWLHRPTTVTGGRSIRYDLVATSATSPTMFASVTNRRSGLLRGLDPSAIYTFTVTPRNSAGAGRATTAAMSRSLASIAGASVPPSAPVAAAPVTPAPGAAAPTAQPAPAAPPAPSGPSAPATKTIYECPAGFIEMGSQCEKTMAYTYTVMDYTFHTVQTGPAPILETYETSANSCNPGYNWEDYGIAKYCRRYGTPPTKTVKDATPTGYTDDGEHWVRKDAPPAGYTDNGTAWATVAAKIARVVPA